MKVAEQYKYHESFKNFSLSLYAYICSKNLKCHVSNLNHAGYFHFVLRTFDCFDYPLLKSICSFIIKNLNEVFFLNSQIKDCPGLRERGNPDVPSSAKLP